jgi:hypothetical protein
VVSWQGVVSMLYFSSLVEIEMMDFADMFGEDSVLERDHRSLCNLHRAPLTFEKSCSPFFGTDN